MLSWKAPTAVVGTETCAGGWITPKVCTGYFDNLVCVCVCRVGWDGGGGGECFFAVFLCGFQESVVWLKTQSQSVYIMDWLCGEVVLTTYGAFSALRQLSFVFWPWWSLIPHHKLLPDFAALKQAVRFYPKATERKTGELREEDTSWPGFIWSEDQIRLSERAETRTHGQRHHHK